MSTVASEGQQQPSAWFLLSVQFIGDNEAERSNYSRKSKQVELVICTLKSSTKSGLSISESGYSVESTLKGHRTSTHGNLTAACGEERVDLRDYVVGD